MKGKKSCYFCNAALKHGQVCRILPPSGYWGRGRHEVECCPRCASFKAGANPGNKDR
jgi:hypothetical protein